MDFWESVRRDAVEVATLSNPPHNDLDKPVIDELERLVFAGETPRSARS